MASYSEIIAEQESKIAAVREIAKERDKVAAKLKELEDKILEITEGVPFEAFVLGKPQQQGTIPFQLQGSVRKGRPRKGDNHPKQERVVFETLYDAGRPLTLDEISTLLERNPRFATTSKDPKNLIYGKLKALRDEGSVVLEGKHYRIVDQ